MFGSSKPYSVPTKPLQWTSSCAHDWQILSEHTTTSRIEELVRNGVRPCTSSTDDTRRKFIQIVTCAKCGQIHRWVEKID